MDPRTAWLRREYEARMNRAMDYAYENCGRDFDLSEMADAACFSRFHFHRMFAAMTGETPAEFVRRLRLAKAAAYLRNAPSMDVTAVALASGFSGSSVFSRGFKERFGVSPSAFRALPRDAAHRLLRDARGDARGDALGDARGDSKQSQASGNAGQTDGKQGQAPEGADGYPHDITSMNGRIPMSELQYTVQVREQPELNVAYARHLGEYSGMGEAFGRLYRWAGPRNLIGPQATHLAVYHDDPDLTPVDKLRSSACVTVPEGTAVDGDIGLMKLPAGTYAIARFEIRQDQFGEAWNALMSEWFPSSGYQPDDRPCYEIYHNDHEKHPERKFIVDICEPVKPL